MADRDLLDGWAFPLFGVLFGYGVAQIARRQAEAGRWAVRRMLWRRSIALLAVGALHGALLYVGDVLPACGVLLFAGVWLVHLRERWLLLVALVFLVLAALPDDGSLTTSSDPPHVTMLPPDLLTMLAERVQVVPVLAVLIPLGFVGPFAVGLVAGRRQILEQPRRHRTVLRVRPWSESARPFWVRSRSRSSSPGCGPRPTGRRSTCSAPCTT